MNWRDLISAKRFGMEEFHKHREENRSEFQRDYEPIGFFGSFPSPAKQNAGFPSSG